MDKAQKGLTLIELMIVLSVLGFLLTYAVPTYKEYALAGKVTEGLNLAQAAQESVVTSFASGDTVAMNADNAYWASQWRASQYVSDITIADNTGIITVTYDTNALPELFGNNTLTITPYIGLSPLVSSAAGRIEWRCTSASHDIINKACSNMGYVVQTGGGSCNDNVTEENTSSQCL